MKFSRDRAPTEGWSRERVERSRFRLRQSVENNRTIYDGTYLEVKRLADFDRRFIGSHCSSHAIGGVGGTQTSKNSGGNRPGIGSLHSAGYQWFASERRLLILKSSPICARKSQKNGAEEPHAPGLPAAAASPSDNTVNTADADKPAAAEQKENAPSNEAAVSQPSEKPVALPKIKHELTQNQTALRDQVRQTLGVFSEAAVQHAAEYRRRHSRLLPALWLHDGNFSLRRFRRTPRERHHLPMLELSPRRFRAADDERRPHCRPHRLRRAVAAFAILGHAGIRPRASELSLARGKRGPHGGRFGRVGKTRLPPGQRSCR